MNDRSLVDEVMEYMKETNLDAEPGDLVHLTRAQLEEIRDFGYRHPGIGYLMRVFEEISHQQSDVRRWHAETKRAERVASGWRFAFFAMLMITAYVVASRFF